MSKSVEKIGERAAYSPPKLTHYGSVRKLTGGSLGGDNDGMGVPGGDMLPHGGMGDSR